MNSKILLTICARHGSKGVKGKNFRILNGHPLIAYTIMQALHWGKAYKVIVSTDSPEIAEIARRYGAEVPFMRPAELATDIAPKLPSIRHALRECETRYNTKFDIIVDLDPTSPVRGNNDLDNCLNIFLEHTPDTIFSVVPANKSPYFNMVEEDSTGTISLCKKLPIHVIRRQDAPKVYNLNASIYFYKRDFLILESNISPITNNSRIYVMNEYSRNDIDCEVDFTFLEFLVKEGIVQI